LALIGELIQWLRTDDDDAAIQEGRVDFGGGDTAICVDYQSANRDCPPVPGDYAVCVPGSESGSYVIVGWVDPWNQGVAKEGEARLYARDGVNVVGALHVTKDGAVPDGIAMELIARADRNDAALNALATTFNSHKHAYTGGGTASGPLSSSVPASDPAGTELIEQNDDNATGCDKVYVT
jgi:hypothetical protein